MWPFDRKLDSLINKTIVVKVHGVKFKIKKIDTMAFMDGSKVMLQAYDIYKLEKSSPAAKISSVEKIKEHYRDIFMASVVEPKLNRKPNQGKDIFVDHLFTEWDLANKLYESIIEYTYEKKKIQTRYFSRSRLEEIDILSQRYGVLPSTFLSKSILELQFDMLVASTGIDAANKNQEKASKRAKMKGRHG